MLKALALYATVKTCAQWLQPTRNSPPQCLTNLKHRKGGGRKYPPERSEIEKSHCGKRISISEQLHIVWSMKSFVFFIQMQYCTQLLNITVHKYACIHTYKYIYKINTYHYFQNICICTHICIYVYMYMHIEHWKRLYKKNKVKLWNIGILVYCYLNSQKSILTDPNRNEEHPTKNCVPLTIT